MKPLSKLYLAVGVFALVAGLATLPACQTVTVIDDESTLTGPSGVNPSPTAPGCEAAVKTVRVNPFGYTCDGVDRPNNSSGLLPLGCTAHVTATPKDQTGKDVPDTVHGPIGQWTVAFGASHVQITPDPNQPFNVNVLALSVGEFSLENTVCNVRGAWAGRVVSP